MLMMKYMKIGGICALLCWWAKLPAQATSQSSIALTIPEITILDIEPNTANFPLALATPTEAGDQASATATNNTKWLNYTCALSSSGTAKKVYVQVTSGTVPAGLSLRVQASNVVGSGAGTRGVPVGLVTLDNTSRQLITGISRCYTGDGANNGHQLTYSLAISSYALLSNSNSTTLTITYTISD